jgi:ATP-dependent DNA helicase RecG
MPCLEWIDQRLSEQLPILRDRGEGQRLEFMEVYPTNGFELSREIAAFASSNAGTIVIGVADDGSLVGLEKAETAKDRDFLCRRIEGLCTSNIKPSITPVVKFAKEGDCIVLAIEVPRGKQPIYYSKNIPYIRHLSQSRPAEPHEVIERIAEWLAATSGGDSERSEDAAFFSALAAILIDIVINAEEFEERSVNPWFDQLIAQFGYDARELRQLASDEIAIRHDLDADLRELATSLDRATSHQLTLVKQSWQTLSDHVGSALARARKLKAEQIDTIPLSAALANEMHRLVRQAARELADLDHRAADMAESARMDELQDEASRIGLALLRAGHHRWENLPDDFAPQLREIGRRLHLVETERLYLDGGQSVQKILTRIHELAEEFTALLARYEI